MINVQNKYHSLTHPQKRIWYIEQIYPNTSLYNIGGPIRCKGTLNFDLLEAAIHYFIKRHDGLRLQLALENGEVKQFVAPYQPFKLDLVDFSQSGEPEEEYNTWVEQESRRIFNLYGSPLFHFTMFRISARDNGYLVRFHHLIADGWTINILTGEICDTYMRLKEGQAVSETAAPSYLEYLELERQYLESERFARDRRFWNEKFSATLDYLPVNNIGAISGRRKTYQWEDNRSLKVKSFCNQKKISLNTLFTVAFSIYRLKTTQANDIILGIPVINRSGRREKQMVGMFTSSMPFRMTATGREDIRQFIRNVNQELLNCYFHQKYPYNLLAQDLELQKKGLDRLYDVCINYYNTRLSTELDGSPIENKEFYNGNQLYALQLVIKDWSDQGKLTVDFDYRLSDFTELQIEKLHESLNLIIDQMLASPDMEIGKFEILTASERKRLIDDFNDTTAFYPRDKTIYQLFEAQVEKTPDKTAASFGNRTLTYGELNQKANQLARFLKTKGLSRESIVGLMTNHSLETVIGIMGILKAGGAYLPIEPDNPPARISFLMNDAEVRILLTNCPPGKMSEINFHGEVVDLKAPEIYRGDDGNPPLSSGPENLAYVIYTSGSTGKPKGVMIEHRGLVNYIWWANKVYISGENEVFALYSSLAFDLTVTSIFTPLIGGHQIHITEDDGTEFILDKILRERKVTIIKLTPAHLGLLQDHDHQTSSVRCFIVGGEDLKTSLAASIQRSFGEKLAIYNEYGPTETVVGCMIHRYSMTGDSQSSVPIGIPADNVQIYLLDRFLQPVLPGFDGEIYIAGDGVARGYLNQRELTGERFVENIFSPGKKMYRTGDLARFLDDGVIEYRGRVDFQVKIHGHRIELGEIESALMNHPLIKEAVVIDRTDSIRGKYLIAYYVGQADLSMAELRNYLAQYLPEYMIPVALMRLAEFPLTINGKVNRSLLPEPPVEEPQPGDDPGFHSEKEMFLAKIIAEVLNIERVRSTDNFFQISGDSIKAIQISAKLKNHAYKIKVKDILAHPVIAEMATMLETNTVFADQAPGVGLIESTPMVAWFFSRNFKNIHYWNQSLLLQLAPQVDVSTLNNVMDTLIKHHDSLRMNLSVETGKLYYNPVYLNQTYSCEIIDLMSISAAEREERLKSTGIQLKSGFNLGNGLLFKAALFHCGPEDHRLLLTAHHLIVDGVSWRIILNDLAELMDQAAQNRPLELPLKTLSYQKWALELDNYRLSTEVALYWKKQTQDEFQFPVDYDQGEDDWEHCKTVTETLPAAETQALLTTANLAYHTEPNELMTIALALVISDWVGESIIILELEGHGREEALGEIDLSRTVGWFTSIYPMRLQIDNPGLPFQIKSLKEQIRGIPNKGFDFGVLKYLKGVSFPERNLIRFNYLGDFENSFPQGPFTVVHEASGLDSDCRNTLTSLLEINAMIVNQRLQIALTYSRNKFADETIQKFSQSYLNQLQVILKHCQAKEQGEFTPADFDSAVLSQADLDQIFT